MKLLVSDLDGTLLGSDKAVYPEVVEAIERWQAAGNVFAIATGRLYTSGIYYAERFLANDYFIGCSGATIYQDGQLIEQTPIELDLVHRLWDIMNQRGGYCQIYSDKWIVANSNGRVVKFYQDFEKLAGPKYRVPTVIQPDVSQVRGPVHKLSFTFDNDQEVDDILAQLGDITGYNLFRSLPYLFDIISDQADKGLAAKNLQTMIGADKLYTVGDNENDIAMLKLADYSAVIETAPPHVLDSADMIVKTPDRGGIVEFIDLLLGKEE